MLKRKNKASASEIFPGGKHTFPSGGQPPPQSRQPKMCIQTFGIKIRRPGSPKISRGTIEKLFMVCIFIVLETMVGWLCFNIMDNTFDSSDFPKDIRGFLMLVQVALFVIFTYAAIMVSFFKVNIFQ